MISVIGFIIIFIVAYFAYKTANDTGRSGLLWAFITVAAGIGIQFVLPIIIGIVLALIYMAGGTPVTKLQEEISGIAIFIGIGSIALSLVAMWLILKHVSKLPEDEPAAAPPPPPTFDQTD